MRLFLAIDLPINVKRKLHNQLKSLKEDYPDFRWVGEENYHITIHFFGEKSSADKISEQITDTVYYTSPFHLYSFKTDLFIRGKIILYLRFQRNKILERLADELKVRLSLPSETRFSPHLTIARYRIPSKQQYLHLKKKLKKLAIDISFEVTKLVLFESILESQKPIYKVVAEFPLK